jgi:hypothetical protein
MLQLSEMALGHYLGRRNCHTAAIVQNGCRVYDVASRITAFLRLTTLRHRRFFVPQLFAFVGTFKVALDAAVSRIACAGSDHAIRIIDWYSGQVTRL